MASNISWLVLLWKYSMAGSQKKGHEILWRRTYICFRRLGFTKPLGLANLIKAQNYLPVMKIKEKYSAEVFTVLKVPD